MSKKDAEVHILIPPQLSDEAYREMAAEIVRAFKAGIAALPDDYKGEWPEPVLTLTSSYDRENG